MELMKVNEFFVTYIRNGNDRNGNPIYLINIFNPTECKKYYNCNYCSDRKKDKYNNIKIQSYNIQDSIKDIIKQIKTTD